MLLQEVLSTTPHVCPHDEKLFLEKFLSLSNDSQRLFIRLYTRKGPWFRVTNISYAEVLDYQLAVKELSAAGYVCSIETISELQKDDLERILNILTVSELQEMLSVINKRLFFCNGEQDLSAFLLVDLGIVKYPTYNVVVTDQIFSSRDDLLSYEEALEAAQIMDESLEENDSSMVLKCSAISESRVSNSAAKTISFQLPNSYLHLFHIFQLHGSTLRWFC